MHKKSFMIIVLTILLVQPVLVGLNMSLTMGPIYNPRVVAQGFRVDPSQLIDHVPIFINGTDDFVSQGWEGSGTSGDPYVIDNLNITRDVGQICIDIMNTDAYFIIEDCFIQQDSNMDAIRLTNTTHGTITYVTSYGQEVSTDDYQAIHLVNANNTVVNHCEVYGRYAMGLLAEGCQVLTFADDLFDSVEYRACRVDDSNQLLIQNCEFYNYDSSWWCTRFYNTNHTVIEDSEFFSDDGAAGLSMSGCHDTAISDCYFWAPDTEYGVEIYDSPSIEIANMSIELATYGFYLDNSPGMYITDLVVSEITLLGVGIDNSPNSTVENVEITNTGPYGLYFTNTGNTSFSDLMINHVDEYAVYGTSSDLIEFDNLLLTDTGDDAFYMDSCNNGSIVSSEIHMADGSGIYIYTGANWTVTNNLVEDTGETAIYQYQGDNFICTGNTVNICENGIYSDDSADALIANNIITNSISSSISFSSCDRAIVSDNEIHDGYDGITLDSSVNLTISGNIIGVDGWNGISLYSIENSIIEENTIINSPFYGITISGYCQELQLLNNELTDCGFYFTPSSGTATPLPYIYFNQTFSGNTINGMDLYYARDAENLVLDADDYAQFILLNVSEVTIQDGSFGHVTCPIEILHSEEIDIDGIDIPENIEGIVLGSCENVTVSDASILGVEPTTDEYYGGMYANDIDNLAILDCEFSRAEGVWAYFSELVFLNNCMFSDGDNGYRGHDTDNVTITHSTFMNLEDYVHYAFPGGDFLVFADNVVMNSARGIYLEEPYAIIEHNYFWQLQYYAMQLYDLYHVIHNNEIYHAGTYGIYLGSSANFVNITENHIESCDIGVLSNSGDDLRIYNNTILYSTQYAIDLYRSSNSEIYYNIFALSGTENARDRDSGTYTKNWDDGSVLGNWWDDYAPPGVYNIIGGASSVDNYPMVYLPTEPIIDHPLDLYYAEGSEGNELTWRPFDDYLKEWKLYIDGTLWDEDAWDFVDVTVNVDGLAYGVYEAEIVIIDNDLNEISDIVIINVFDDTPPVISNVPNTWAFVGGSNQVLSWEVSDLHPDTYLVTLDEEEYESGTWTTGTLEVNIDGLTEGEHVLVTYIYDIDGNVAADGVQILAIDDGIAPTIDNPADITYTIGETGNSIVWEPEDEYPATFQVTYNGSIQVSGSWGGARIVVNVDGLPGGTHIFAITVADGSGNSVSDSVTVTVLSIEGVEPPPEPLDVGLILLIAGGVGAVVVVVAVIFFLRKRGAA